MYLKTVSVFIRTKGSSTLARAHRVDPRQLLAHVHDDDGDQLQAKGALGQQAEHRQAAVGLLRLLLQTHL